MTPTPQPSEADKQRASDFVQMLRCSHDVLNLAHAFAAVRAEGVAQAREELEQSRTTIAVLRSYAATSAKLKHEVANIEATLAKYDAIRARGEAKLDESTPKS